MKYLSVHEIAKKWKVSERSVRHYCAKGRVEGALLIGKTWNIPEHAQKPERKNKRKNITLLEILKEQKAHKYSGGDLPQNTDRFNIPLQPHGRKSPDL